MKQVATSKNNGGLRQTRKKRVLALVFAVFALLISFNSLAGFIPSVAAKNNDVAYCDTFVVQGGKLSASQQAAANKTPIFKACKTGYDTGYGNPGDTDNDRETFCQSNASENPGVCEDGYVQGQKDKKAEKPAGTPGGAPTAAQIQAIAAKECAPYQTQSGISKDDQDTNYKACVAGVTGQKNGKSQEEACGSGQQVAACIDGFTNAPKNNAITPGTASPTLSPTGGTGGSGGDDTPGCEGSGLQLGWILCPVIEGIATAVDGIYSNIVQPLLVTKPIDIANDSNDPTHTFAIWSNFRIYANIFLVIALLVVVFGESVGGGLIDAYAAKKILPRLLVAAILINISIYVMAFAVDITNVIGAGLGSLIEQPFKAAGSFKIHINDGTGALGVAAMVGGSIWAAGAIAALSGFLLVFLLIPTFFIFLAIMATVLLRRVIIIFLVLSAPIAFALYCLPNTEKYFRKWADLLGRTLMIYPIISVIFALANIVSVTIGETAGGVAGTYAQFLGIAALVMPLFLIPYSFRIAGGLLGQVHELTRSAGSRAAEMAKGSEKNPDSMRNRARRNLGESNARRGYSGKAFSTRFKNPTGVFTEEGRAQRRENQAAVRESMVAKYAAEYGENDTVMKMNAKNDQYQVALADQNRAAALRQKAVDSADEEALRTGQPANYTAVAAWDQAIAAARITPRNSATRLSAINAVAASGFHYDQGQAGYNQLAETMASITGANLERDATGNVTGATGANAGAYTNAMNQAQYNFRTAGRYDLGGINNGTGFDAKAGTDKASLYELANGKGESIEAMSAHLAPTGPVGQSGAVLYKELEAMKGNAKGGNRDKIIAQMQNLETRGVKEFMMADSSEKVIGRGVTYNANIHDPSSARYDQNAVDAAGGAFTAADISRGYKETIRTLKNEEVAIKTARAYERPDPDRMTT